MAGAALWGAGMRVCKRYTWVCFVRWDGRWQVTKNSMVHYTAISVAAVTDETIS